MTALQRLLKYPHAAVFDKRPGSVLAFRLQHPAGAEWSVADGVMRASAGGHEFTYSLSGRTVASLCAALAADGFQIIDMTSTVSGLTALVLIEAEGGAAVSNGDQVQGFTSLLWVILSAYAAEVSEAGVQVGEALRQMVMTQSEGVWLDLWGALYSVAREPGETDAHYAPRIPKEAFRVRVNKYGIEQAILDATGSDVRIAEPWREIFHLNHSLLSGPDKIYDGENVGYHLIRPEATDNVDWPAVYRVIERNRAAGVTVLQSRVTRSVYVDGQGAEVFFRGERQLRAWSPYEDRPLLSYMRIEDAPVLNHAARQIRIKGFFAGIVVDPASYSVGSGRFSSYRTYNFAVEYSGHSWASYSAWATPDVDWTTTAIIQSKHTRS